MSEEKLKILEMLREGKITTEEAMALLKQVQSDNEHPHRFYSHDWDHIVPHHPRPDFGWINDLRSAMEETTRNVLFSTDELMFGTSQEKFTSSSNIGDGIHELVFEGKNAPVRLRSYVGTKIEVEAYYKTKSRWNPRLTFTEENGVFSLSYDDNALYLLGIIVRIPETAHIGSIRLKNRNAPISVDDIEAEEIKLSTKNESIRVFHTKGERLYCETKNAPIALDDVKMREIDAQTNYSPISLDEVDAFSARLVTNNAKIDVKSSDVVQLYAKTSDSPLRFDNLGYKEQETVCSIDAITTNGQISIHLPHRELKCKLRASTTIGGIFSELHDLEYQVNEKNYMEAQTHGYETAPNKLNLNLQTTNNGIYVKQ